MAGTFEFVLRFVVMYVTVYVTVSPNQIIIIIIVQVFCKDCYTEDFHKIKRFSYLSTLCENLMFLQICILFWPYSIKNIYCFVADVL